MADDKGTVSTPWYKSKKVWATLIAVVMAFVGNVAPAWREPIQQALYAIMAYVVGQGIADINKKPPVNPE